MVDAPRRQLAAIMFADMVGYTALMQRDERRALDERDRHRAILSQAVSRHRGTVLEYYGDGTLSIFASAVEAVECAVAIQRAIAGDSLIPLRIGVHTGDVVHEGSGVSGDGVNVASRIQGLAAPAGVMISGKVFDEIKNHPAIQTVSIGAVQMKNVGYLLNVFAISGEGVAVPSRDEVRKKVEAEGHGVFFPPGTATGEDGTPLPMPSLGTGEAFLKGVRDRALVQWALVYLAVSWVVLSVARFAGDRLGWSPPVLQGLGVFAFLGFIAAMIVAWHHGEKGRQPVRRLEVALIVLLLVAGVTALSLLPAERALRAGEADAALAVDPRPSIAALPWVNRSGRSEDSYFTDGIHDEILTRLSKIGGLRVISRQSVMQFRDSPLTTAQIAAQLGVRYILEAGLLRVRDTVRISVQLIDAQTDHVAWAVTQDRALTMENLLGLQAEIAQVIADTLRATVTSDERIELARQNTDNLQAYDFYLQGRDYYLRPGYIEDNFQLARGLFERAVALDPGFALAHAALSHAHGQLYWEGFDRSAERLAAQRVAAEEALRLDPALPQAHQAIGWMHSVLGDFEEALGHYTHALERMPSDAGIVASVGYTHRRLRHWPEVFAFFERAVQLNPRDATLLYDLGGHSYALTRRYEEAMGAYNRALELAPDLHDAALRKGYTWLNWHGELDSLQAVIASFPEGLHTLEVDKARIDLAFWERDGDAMLRILEGQGLDVYEMQLVYEPRSLYAGWAHRYRGDAPAARAAFESARQHLEEIRRTRPEDERVLAALGFAYAGLGRTADAARAAEAAAAANASGANVLTEEQSLESCARIFAQAGLAEQAIELLEALLVANSPVSAHTLRVDPLYDPIRQTPAFRALLDKFSERIPPQA
jgi:TolB-like protein/class 3 adenylate cyclase/Flp pilus assembly protein TadD